jgi:adenosylcobinamide-GDP ribazoletransferase
VRPAGLLGDPLVALRYLTAVPLPAAARAGDLGRAAAWFPVVGLLVGGALGLLSGAADRVAPPPVSAALVLIAWVAITGGLHLDGLADACDGLGGGWTRERALLIMRDPHTGPYGATGVVLVLGLKAAALASLPDGLVWRALLAAAVLARAAPLLLVRLCPPARPDGAGQAFAAGLRWPGLLGGGLVAAATALATLGAWGGVALAVAGGATGALAAYLRRRLGGFTGDCLGALVEATEAAVLTVAVALERLDLA